MSHSSLIVARMDPANASAVSELFAKSDATELPHMVGVVRRTLLTFHDLYFHLVEADESVPQRVNEVREHPLFQELNTELSQYITPYHPSWREPKDAMAKQFYQWNRA